VARIELFRHLPEQLIKGLEASAAQASLKIQRLLKARCVRLVFRNEAERWVADIGDAEGHGIRFDGATLPPARLVNINRDEMGSTVLIDKRSSRNIKANPVKLREWQRAHTNSKQSPRTKPEN
jgi:hypothetical protein